MTEVFFGAPAPLTYFVANRNNSRRWLKDVAAIHNLEGLRIDLPDIAVIDSSVFAIVSLTILTLEFCASLTGLPDELGSLTALRKLEILSCVNFSWLPDSLGCLLALEEMSITCQHLNENNVLTYLPATLGNLKNLKWLDLRGMAALKTLPESVCDLHNLRRLWLARCNSIDHLDACLAYLPLLVWLQLPRVLEDKLVLQGNYRLHEISSVPRVIKGLTGVDKHMYKILLLVLRRRRLTLPPELWEWMYNEFLI